MVELDEFIHICKDLDFVDNFDALSSHNEKYLKLLKLEKSQLMNLINEQNLNVNF